jgi:ribonuclease HI
MKKKHLRSLNSIEKWLKNSELATAFALIRAAIEGADEAKEETSETLPPPKEISEEPQTIALYSDGGCRGNPGPGAFAYLVQNHGGDILLEGVDFESLTTNNKMELNGPLQGLKKMKEFLPLQGQDPLLTKIKVITDSKYVVEGMKSWVSGWKARGWKKADNKVPENVELWMELDQIRNSFMQVEWMWVKGHAGHPQNEYCDRKANELMDEKIS